MASRISRMISLSRDNLVHLMRQNDFLNAVPGLGALKPQFDECNEAFDKSAKERGCRCRADTTLLTPCMSAFIAALEESKTGDQELMRQFIQFVAKTPTVDTVGVTIFYAPPDGSAPQRYVYP